MEEITFDRLYPDALPLEQIEFDGSFLVKSDESHKCWNCGKDTHWIDGNFEAPLCSPGCETEKWAEYFEALSNHIESFIPD